MGVLERVRAQEGLETQDDSIEQGKCQSVAREARDRLKSQLVERLGLSALAELVSASDARQARTELDVACRAILNDQAFAGLMYDERDAIVRQVLDDVVGLGPIQWLLDDDAVSEVMVNGVEGLFYEKGGRLFAAESQFESVEQILVVIDRILAPLGRRMDRSSPIVNARLANGDRVNAVSDSVALNGPIVTIRKFSNRITSLARLVELGSVPPWYATLLTWAVRLRQDIAVAGGTGSGKTTLLNALSCEISPSERIVTIEDSAELRFTQHPNVVRLEARDASIEGTGEVTIRDLVKNALRMRPDRIVVGECRGEEAIDMLQAMNTGHDGSLTTLHAGTPQEAILRLVLMARFGMDLPAGIIEEQIASALDLLVMSNRAATGARYITSLSEVSRAPEGGVTLTDCVLFSDSAQEWELVREPMFVQGAVDAGLLDAGEVEQWRSSLPSRCAA